jgi:opacity protein-like surface antigen
MRRFITGTVAVLAVASAGMAQAQSPVGLELRGGVALPTADFGAATLDAGGGGGFTINYRFLPHMLAYAGWDWFLLRTDEPFAGADYDVENNGYAFGLQFQHPVLKDVGYWVRAGGLYNHIELEDSNGDQIADSGHDLGWEAGGGLRVPLGQHFALTPGVRYRTLSTDLSVGQTTYPVDLSYVTAEIGVQYNFGARRVTSALVR